MSICTVDSENVAKTCWINVSRPYSCVQKHAPLSLFSPVSPNNLFFSASSHTNSFPPPLSFCLSQFSSVICPLFLFSPFHSPLGLFSTLCVTFPPEHDHFFLFLSSLFSSVIPSLYFLIFLPLHFSTFLPAASRNRHKFGAQLSVQPAVPKLRIR